MEKREIETFEDPINYTPNNVCYWEEESKQLLSENQKAILSKAKAFILAGCINQISETEWICQHLKGYNKADHTIRSTDQGLECGCQGFQIKAKKFNDGNSEIKPFCSHTIAVKQFCFLEAHQ